MDGKFWQITYADIRQKIRVYVGYEQSRISQDYQNLMEMMTQAFGGDSDSSGSNIPPGTKVVQTEADLNAFMKAFN